MLNSTILIRRPIGVINSFLNYNVVSGCTPANRTINCTLQSSDPTNVFTNGSNVIGISANTFLGRYSVGINCMEAGAYNASANVTLYVVTSSPVILQAAPQNLHTLDGQWINLSNNVLVATTGTDFPATYICYKIGDKSIGWWKVTTSNPLCDFTQSDVDNGVVSYMPPASSGFGESSSTYSVSLTVGNTIGASVNGSMSFVVNFSLAFQPFPITILITVPSGQAVLSKSILDFEEIHHVSLWDANITLPPLDGIGVWEWYCPDQNCGGVGWNQIQTDYASVPQVNNPLYFAYNNRYFFNYE